MYPRGMTSKESFLEQTKAAREERAMEKKREASATTIQAWIRGWLARQRFKKLILENFDNLLPELHISQDEATHPLELVPALEVYQATCRLFLVFDKNRDKKRFEKLCKYIVHSLHSDSIKMSYVGVFLNKDYSLSWIAHIKELLNKCCIYLEELKPESPLEMQSILVHLHTLLEFTATNTWALTRSKNFEKLRGGMTQLCANIMGSLFHRGYYLTLKSVLMRGLCREKPALRRVGLSALVTLSLRPLLSAHCSDKLLTVYIIHLLSVPGLVHHMQATAPESLEAFKTHGLLDKTVTFLAADTNLLAVFGALEANLALGLLGNLVQLALAARDAAAPGTLYPTFVQVATRMLDACKQSAGDNKSNLTNWHPLLGWLSAPLDPLLPPTMATLRTQLSLLWGAPMLKTLLGDPLKEILESGAGVDEAGPSQPPAPASSHPAGFIRRAIEARTNGIHMFRAGGGRQPRRLDSGEATRVSLTCALYLAAARAMPSLRLDVITGLCNQEDTLHALWQFLSRLGPGCGLKAHLELAGARPDAPPLRMLLLFAECMTHYVTILDDVEMYEKQSPFRLADFVAMSQFLNLFVYRAIMGQVFDIKTLSTNELFTSLHGLLLVLYRRDCRRAFSPRDHWLVREMREDHFMHELDKGKKPHQVLLHKAPHMVAYAERVRLFRRAVADEKVVLGLTERACSGRAAQVLVRRSRLVEDGYRQLAALPARALLAQVRVRFVNEQGLDEAGIDQDGLFKEFLEETIKRVFDPSLNLFRATTDERLYPSPSSALQDNHLQLFEFIGRMLGKAVYEGIVVDVPFAQFFLSQVLGASARPLYSCVDELSSLDRDLYRSLAYIKHFQGDVSTLELTFTVDEERLGEIVTHELIPGGKAVPVTNDNKINYIHLMAHFRMHTQIKEQTNAFIKGFRTIINPDWLGLFSTPELQRLISGDNVPLDLRDLRRHTQYYGGFHDSHRVVCWLWDVLQRDFTPREQAMFLKFVTSCSKPPVLGFAHLKPAFSVRCVEVADDDDTGDTIGSVIRGFFTIRKKDPLNRLPTSSTCFNLLKLPNYQKRSTLRDKLRYAVTSNTGFELS